MRLALPQARGFAVSYLGKYDIRNVRDRMVQQLWKFAIRRMRGQKKFRPKKKPFGFSTRMKKQLKLLKKLTRRFLRITR